MSLSDAFCILARLESRYFLQLKITLVGAVLYLLTGMRRCLGETMYGVQ